MDVGGSMVTGRTINIDAMATINDDVMATTDDDMTDMVLQSAPHPRVL
jgi:predicted nuclease of predicted toxin-antitoxin system